MYRPYHRQWQRQLKHVAAFLSACCCGVVPFRVVNLKVTMKALFQGKWQFIRVHGNTGTFDPPFSHYQSAATETITSHLTATMAWDDHQSELLLREIDAWQNHQNLKRRWHDWHYGMWWMLLRKLHLSKVNRYAANSFVTETIFFLMDISVVVQCKVEVCDSMNSPTKSPEEGDWIRLNLLQRGRT